MPHWLRRDTTGYTDEAYQRYILQGVSRTFALTIPELPLPLERSVGNAYLLCRVADTIEDDPDLTSADKTRFAEWFVDVVAGEREPEEFSRALTAALSQRALPAERDLAQNLSRVLAVTRRQTPGAQRSMDRCVRIMARGMAHFQRNASVAGLADLRELDQYCYHVAGVVGEMLTELYGEYSPDFAAHRAEMMPLAVSFGQGLQMTNILKDVWEDLARGACWLPGDVMQQCGLSRLAASEAPPSMTAVLNTLIGIAHGHLANALRYTLLIPARERGIRRFCLLAIGMAMLTLRRIHDNPSFRRSEEIKISRHQVRAVMALAGWFAGRDQTLARLFRWAGRGLPLASSPVTWCATPVGTDEAPRRRAESVG